MKKRTKILLIILGVFVILIGGFAIYIGGILSEFNYKELDKDDLGLSSIDADLSSSNTEDKPQQEVLDPNVINIALFGVDQRNKETQVHSDAIIIASINMNEHTIKMSSIMRDALVDIEGYEQNKLTQAYFLGGPQLAVKTLNQNFHLNISEYATVNFAQMANIIDAVGGVTITLTEEERLNANISIQEQSVIAGLPKDFIQEAGTQHLNGTQAVAYARIRHVGNGDFARTERQRTVLKKIFEKALTLNPIQYPELARELFPTFETSLSLTEILEFSDVLLHKPTLEENRFPQNADLIGNGAIWIDSKTQCVNYDKVLTEQHMKEFIYNFAPTSSDIANNLN